MNGDKLQAAASISVPFDIFFYVLPIQETTQTRPDTLVGVS